MTDNELDEHFKGESPLDNPLAIAQLMAEIDVLIGHCYVAASDYRPDLPDEELDEHQDAYYERLTEAQEVVRLKIIAPIREILREELDDNWDAPVLKWVTETRLVSFLMEKVVRGSVIHPTFGKAFDRVDRFESLLWPGEPEEATRALVYLNRARKALEFELRRRLELIGFNLQELPRMNSISAASTS